MNALRKKARLRPNASPKAPITTAAPDLAADRLWLDLSVFGETTLLVRLTLHEARGILCRAVLVYPGTLILVSWPE